MVLPNTVWLPICFATPDKHPSQSKSLLDHGIDVYEWMFDGFSRLASQRKLSWYRTVNHSALTSIRHILCFHSLKIVCFQCSLHKTMRRFCIDFNLHRFRVEFLQMGKSSGWIVFPWKNPNHFLQFSHEMLTSFPPCRGKLCNGCKQSACFACGMLTGYWLFGRTMT